METANMYVTINVGVSLTRKTHEELVVLCDTHAIAFAKAKSGEYLLHIKSLIQYLGMDNQNIPPVSYVDPNEIKEVYREGESTPEVLNEKKSPLTIHHDDAPLFPPLSKKILLENKEEEFLPSPVVEEALPSFPPQNISEVPKETKESFIQDAQVVVEESKPKILTGTHLVADGTENSSGVDSPIFTVVPNFIDTTKADLEKEEERGFPQNPRPIVPTKFIPVPHVPINQPVPSLHPLNQPPLVIPFATPAPAAHTKIAAVYTQPYAKVSDWMPWMRTSQWLKRAVQKATSHPHISHIHSPPPAIVSASVSSGVKTSSELVSTNSPHRDTVVQAPLQSEKLPISAQAVAAPTPVYNDEPRARVIRMDPPTRPKDALDAALFGAYAEQSPVAQQKETIRLITEHPLPPSNPPVISDSWDALMFGGK